MAAAVNRLVVEEDELDVQVGHAPNAGANVVAKAWTLITNG